MSGHSHWATIRRKKGAADAKKGAIFTKLAKEIVLAVRSGGGGEADTNVSLQLAIERARAQNMPKDNIERAIRRGTGDDKEGIVIEECNYEGYAPHGVAMIISCLTDNRNRTVADVRHILNRYGGSLAEAGSVSWQFARKSYFSFPLDDHDPDKIFELAVEAGADDVTFEDGEAEITGAVEVFKSISDSLHEADIIPEDAGLRMVPSNMIDLDTSAAVQVLRVIEAMEELDDVQNVYHNLNISEEAINALES